MAEIQRPSTAACGRAGDLGTEVGHGGPITISTPVTIHTNGGGTSDQIPISRGKSAPRWSSSRAASSATKLGSNFGPAA
ncbi:hypothetical protein C5688_13230 [Methylocystis sp. MitZ-2018]|nr:hypothetical protein C5688_13230 [Methylocystis sp. MitZ-2018]